MKTEVLDRVSRISMEDSFDSISILRNIILKKKQCNAMQKKQGKAILSNAMQRNEIISEANQDNVHPR